jgi:hypothetical protein
MLVLPVYNGGAKHARPDETVSGEFLGEKDGSSEEISSDDVEESDEKRGAHQNETGYVGNPIDGVEDLFHARSFFMINPFLP